MIFGHGRHLDGEVNSSIEYDKVCDELNRYEKNPYVYIFKHEDLPNIIKDVEDITVMGFSFSLVDEGYIDWIIKNTSKTCNWRISYYSDLDKERINNFILHNSKIIDRYEFFKIEENK